MKIVHITTSLGTGGTERNLVNLLLAKNNHHENCVVVLNNKHFYLEKLRAHGIECIAVNFSNHLSDITKIIRLAKKLKKMQPDIIQTWLYHSDLVGSILSLYLKVPLVWNVRNTNLNFKKTTRSNYYCFRILSKISFLPKKIIANSSQVQASHIANGYQASRWQIINNGVDTQGFKPNADAKKIFLRDHHLPDNAMLIGFFGRYSYEKNFEHFLKGMHHYIKQHKNYYCVLAGKAVTKDNVELQQLLAQYGLKNNTVILGELEHVAQSLQALDILTLTSFSEGSPNIILEAMACGVPCVSTDVGNVTHVLDQAAIIPHNDITALMQAWDAILNLEQDKLIALRSDIRTRIVEHFSLQSMVSEYTTLYQQLRLTNT